MVRRRFAYFAKELALSLSKGGQRECLQQGAIKNRQAS